LMIKRPTPNGQSKQNPCQLWHPGIHIGWARGFWAQLFDEVKQANPNIPYEALPGEMFILSSDP